MVWARRERGLGRRCLLGKAAARAPHTITCPATRQTSAGARALARAASTHLVADGRAGGERALVVALCAAAACRLTLLIHHQRAWQVQPLPAEELERNSRGALAPRAALGHILPAAQQRARRARADVAAASGQRRRRPGRGRVRRRRGGNSGGGGAIQGILRPAGDINLDEMGVAEVDDAANLGVAVALDKALQQVFQGAAGLRGGAGLGRGVA